MTIDALNGPSTIAGFWRRLGAFFLDGLLLGFIGIAFGHFLTAEFVQLGPWGRLLGFSVAAIYFGALNSKIAGGQTLGKRLLKIKVVTESGKPLSVPTAFVRFIPLGVPWFLNNAQFSESILFSFWFYVTTIVVFGVGLSVVYLYVFNRKSRQSLHDLLVGSYVVSIDVKEHVVAPAIWNGHIAACILLMIASGVAPYFTKNFISNESFTSLMDVSHAMSSQPWILNTQVNKGQTFSASTSNGQSTTTFLNIAAYSKDPDIENARRAKKLADLALATDKTVARLDIIQITLIYGYDLGIASSWRYQNYVHSPAEWRAQ